jgi:Tol biopolymer transport system component
MSTTRFFLVPVVVIGLVIIPGLGCATQTTQAPTPASSPPTVPIAATAPVLSQPVNESTISSLTVKFEWSPSAAASSYGLQVATDSAFSNLLLDKPGITNSNFELTSGLNWKTAYYWRVNAESAGGTSPWSESWKFNTPVLELGKIAFMSGLDSKAKVPQIYIMNDDGSNWKRLTNNMAGDWWPELSPDGSKIVFYSNRDGNSEIYVMDTTGDNQQRLTNNKAFDGYPKWLPDGRISFVSDRAGSYAIYIMNADGSNQTRLANDPYFEGVHTWSPDGTKVAFNSDRDGNPEIYVMNADGSHITRLTTNPAQDIFPAWSPDNIKIAFQSDRNGNFEIYAMNVDGSNQTRLTNNPGNDKYAAWSPDSSKIAFDSDRDCKNDVDEVYIMNSDGSSQTRITSNCANSGVVSWH